MYSRSFSGSGCGKPGICTRYVFPPFPCSEFSDFLLGRPVTYSTSLPRYCSYILLSKAQYLHVDILLLGQTKVKCSAAGKFYWGLRKRNFLPFGSAEAFGMNLMFLARNILKPDISTRELEMPKAPIMLGIAMTSSMLNPPGRCLPKFSSMIERMNVNVIFCEIKNQRRFTHRFHLVLIQSFTSVSTHIIGFSERCQR